MPRKKEFGRNDDFQRVWVWSSRFSIYRKELRFIVGDEVLVLHRRMAVFQVKWVVHRSRFVVTELPPVPSCCFPVFVPIQFPKRSDPSLVLKTQGDALKEHVRMRDEGGDRMVSREKAQVGSIDVQTICFP